jgi:hypothetical protein
MTATSVDWPLLAANRTSALSTYILPGHIQAAFTIGSIEALLGAHPEVDAPFIAAVRRQGERVFIRIRTADDGAVSPDIDG